MKKPERIAHVQTALGPVPVVYVDAITSDEGKVLDALGYVSFTKRRVQIRNGQDPRTEAHTLLHEWAHLILWDSGANNFLSCKKTEVMCDVIATALLSLPIPRHARGIP